MEIARGGFEALLIWNSGKSGNKSFLSTSKNTSDFRSFINRWCLAEINQTRSISSGHSVSPPSLHAQSAKAASGNISGHS